MAYLTYLGAHAEAPDKIDLEVAAQPGGGPDRREPVRLRRLPQVRRGGQRDARAGSDQDRREAAGGRDRAHAAQPDGADALLRRPAAGEVQRARRLPGGSEVRAERRNGRAGDTRASGPVDVRSHRRPLRPDELGHVGGPAPPLARARRRPAPRSRPGRPRARRLLRHRRPGARAAPAGRAHGARRGARLLRADAGAGARASRRRRARRSTGSRATRSSCPFEDGELRRRDGRLRRAQRGRPPRAIGRDGARRAARRAGW